MDSTAPGHRRGNGRGHFAQLAAPNINAANRQNALRDFPIRLMTVIGTISFVKIWELDNVRIENADLSEKLLLAEKRAPQRFEGYGARIDSNRQRIDELLKLTDQAQQDQQQLLESLAISKLREQQQRIDSYLTHAQFSVAQIQDKAAHSKEDSKP